MIGYRLPSILAVGSIVGWWSRSDLPIIIMTPNPFDEARDYYFRGPRPADYGVELSLGV